MRLDFICHASPDYEAEPLTLKVIYRRKRLPVTWQDIAPLNHPHLDATLDMVRQQSDEFLARRGWFARVVSIRASRWCGRAAPPGVS